MLNRNKKPNQGLWNGVGGKLEPGESPIECVLREIAEETDLQLLSNQIECRGQVTWYWLPAEGGSPIFQGGMYLYAGDIPDGVSCVTPRRTVEGILEFKDTAWLLSEDNHGVVSNIREFLPRLFDSSPIAEYRCYYILSGGRYLLSNTEVHYM